MFAYVVPGRLVQQTIQDPSHPERFLGQLESVQDLNHITVFLTGQAPFPQGYGATVHLEIPGKGFQLIGGLSNDKPSAIFRLKGTSSSSSSSSSSTSTSTSQFTPTTASSSSSTTATLGILCQPLESIAIQLNSLPSTSSNALVPSTTTTINQGLGTTIGGDQAVKLAQLIGKNLFNAVSGFVKPLPSTNTNVNLNGSNGNSSDGWIEFSQVENWFRNFETKLRTRGIGFLLQSD